MLDGEPRLIGGLGLVWGEDKALQFARDIVAKINLLLTRAPRESLSAKARQTAMANQV